MSKSTKHARILDFPFGVSLSGGRVERLQEVTNDRRCDYVLDYQELIHTSPVLFSEGKRVFERVKGYYKPRRLRFISAQAIRRTGLFERLDSLPFDHASRSLHAALHWRPPDKTMPLYLLFNGDDESGSCLFSAQKCRIEKRTGKATATSFIRDWSPAPPLPSGLVPKPKRLHERYGGDPVTIHLGKRTYHKRLWLMYRTSAI